MPPPVVFANEKAGLHPDTHILLGGAQAGGEMEKCPAAENKKGG